MEREKFQLEMLIISPFYDYFFYGVNFQGMSNFFISIKLKRNALNILLFASLPNSFQILTQYTHKCHKALVNDTEISKFFLNEYMSILSSYL